MPTRYVYRFGKCSENASIPYRFGRLNNPEISIDVVCSNIIFF